MPIVNRNVEIGNVRSDGCTNPTTFKEVEVKMLLRYRKAAKRTVTFLVVGLVFAVFASTASAECGPGFTNKKQLIHYYQHNPSAAHGFRKELLAHPNTGYQADETVVNWLKSPEQKVFNAPSGYVLNSNTYCPGGAGQYQPYGGLLGNMAGKPMLWHCNKDGECIPVLKGYCMNFVCGPPVHKSPPKCKCRKPKPPKCKCHKHHHHKKRVSCKAIGKVTGPAGSCVNQTVTVTPKQECEASNHSSTGCQQTTVTVVANCSNVAVGTSGPVGQGGNCQTGGEQTCVGQGNCIVETPPPPCGCTPPPPPPVKHWTQISCTGFEEISGGGSFLVDCAVSDDNGAPISLDAHSNDGNSRVSGINCYSNGGSQTCPSGGTFEFRVSGKNSGSSILYSSITATASANGVPATFTSDPFPVDPEDGGF